MAGKNTAAFGIYRTQADVEYAVDLLRAEGFRNTDISVLFPENQGTKDFAVERAPRRRKEQLPASRPAPLLAELWAGSQALVRWRSLG
jgi:hypothetical protein